MSQSDIPPVAEERTRADAATGLKSSHSHSRLSSYGPDFLEFVANKYTAFKRGKGDYQQKLKLVTGSNAEKLYRKFVGTFHESEGTSSTALPPTKPLVFAVASNESGKKGVKFYKTWQRKNSGSAEEPTNDSAEHRLGFLDTEFDRVMGFLDTEFKRMSIASDDMSVMSLPFLRSVALDTSRLPSQDAPGRILRATNPDLPSISEVLGDATPQSSESHRPTVPLIDTSSRDTTHPTQIVSSPDADDGLNTPTAPASSTKYTSKSSRKSSDKSRHSGKTTSKHETPSSSPEQSTSSSRKRHRSKRAHTSSGALESHTTDSEAGHSSASKSSDRTRGSSLDSAENPSDFTIVLLEDGKDYFVDRRRERKRSSKSKKESPQKDGQAWWAPLGELPPSRPDTPRLLNPSTDLLQDDADAWWTPHATPEKGRDTPAYDDLVRSDSGAMTWKKFVEPLVYRPPTIHEPSFGVIEPTAIGLVSPWSVNGSEFPSPATSSTGSYIHSPYSYASPGSVYSYAGSPLPYYSGYSGNASLPITTSYVVLENPIFVDETGYPYIPV